jgi:hypothetical protein
MKRLGLLLLAIAILGTNCYATEANNPRPRDGMDMDSQNARFTDEEIEEDVRIYVDVVFGEEEPTLQDYFNFEGEHGEMGESPDCIQNTRSRANNAARVPSFYYGFLRDLLNTENGKLVIHKIRPVNRGKREMQIVLIDASMGETPVQFYHAGDARAVALGLVGISRINDERITEILKKRKIDCE